MDDKLHKFVTKAQEIHGDRYGYAEFVYQSPRTKGIILCKEHGRFEKTPDHHIHRRQGCKLCSRQAFAKRSTLTTEEFITKARQVHGDLFDYDMFEYVRGTVKGKIRCRLHDVVFEQSPAHHLSGHCACDECIKSKSEQTQLEKYGAVHHSKTSEFVEKVKATSLEKFGVEHHSKTADFNEKMQQANLERFGVPYASQSAAFQERVRATSQDRFGVPHHNMAHISEAALSTLGDKTLLETLLKTNSIREAAIQLGVSDCTVGRYCHMHGMERSQSSYEDAIVGFLREHEFLVKRGNRTLIKRKHVDIILPDYRIGIEFGGLYWHQESIRRPEKYHLDKLERMTAIGYRLITIFEDEWLHKREIVEGRLLYALGKGDQGVGARQLQIEQITARKARSFLNRYHIQGTHAGFCRYAAFHCGKMVAVMSFAHPRCALGRKTGADELVRFATDGKNYPGVASRLFQRFVRDHNPTSIISYADRRWSNGGLYEQLGFELTGASRPNYWYIDFKNLKREHRYKYAKHNINELVPDGERKSGSQIMFELGRRRIWDCGSLCYMWTAPQREALES